MSKQIHKGSRARTVLNIACFGLLWLTLSASTARATATEDNWQLSVPVYLAAGSHYYTSSGTTGTFNSISAYVEAVLSSPARPYSVGMFVDYSYSSDRRNDGTVNAGGLIEYEFDNWDTNAYLFTNRSPGVPSIGLYAGRVRYEVVNNHKLGIELIGTLREPSASTLMFGYYGTISRSLSLNFVSGASLRSARHRAARIELVWQIE